jgi:ribosomal protein L40E
MPKKLFPEATARLFQRVFVCRVCKSKIRADVAKVRAGKVKCRKCGSRALRPKRGLKK